MKSRAQYCKASYAVQELNYLEWYLKERMQWEGKMQFINWKHKGGGKLRDRESVIPLKGLFRSPNPYSWNNVTVSM